MEIRRPDWLRILMCRAVSSDVQMWGRRLSMRRRRMTDDMLFIGSFDQLKLSFISCVSRSRRRIVRSRFEKSESTTTQQSLRKEEQKLLITVRRGRRIIQRSLCSAMLGLFDVVMLRVALSCFLASRIL